MNQRISQFRFPSLDNEATHDEVDLEVALPDIHHQVIQEVVVDEIPPMGFRLRCMIAHQSLQARTLLVEVDEELEDMELAGAVTALRQSTLDQAYLKHSHRRFIFS